ncbi:SGNH/GDSL hydrolase family protein [Leptospira harrisiae]|uniref:SGNH hydrolase-type esterase domain-containing protein n=1 Tax=Leptospira harrisiae TaxID=2023189 RepID=A0A2N0AK65_9LEPT|nr:SGNH/GDSL hydrolase family protein [Leptospira harrisiae]PJZ84660.1 hypothetical protein CH364_11695 [Leptospira harrisiae]PKA07400.1 hypothetical protein CH366_13395 [Leptospira harrisiae]
MKHTIARILAFTDSLGMPRKGTPVESTWTEKLLSHWKNTSIVYLKNGRGFTSNNLMEELDEIVFLKPTTTILQVGICDCTRRGVPPKIERWIRRVPYLRRFVLDYIKRNNYKFTKFFDYRYISLKQFEDNIQKSINRITESQSSLIIIAIAPPGEHMIKNVFNIEEDIKTFNTALNELANSNNNVIFINPYEGKLAKEVVVDYDGHHLSENGHELVFQKINEALIN